VTWRIQSERRVTASTPADDDSNLNKGTGSTTDVVLTALTANAGVKLPHAGGAPTPSSVP